MIISCYRSSVQALEEAWQPSKVSLEQPLSQAVPVNPRSQQRQQKNQVRSPGANILKALICPFPLTSLAISTQLLFLQQEEDSSSEAPSYPGGMSDASIGSEKPQAEVAPSEISLPQLSRSLSSRPLLKHLHEGASHARQVFTDPGAGTLNSLMVVAPGVPCKCML